jgi:hypothetical protein
VPVYLAVLAVQALTLLRALFSGPVAFAVILAALRFLTGAATHGHEGGYAFEGAGVPKVGHLLGLVDLELAAGLVAAADAQTLLVAEPSLREALTVHLETVDLGALAAGVGLGLLAGGEVKGSDGAEDVVVLRELGFVDEQVE